MELIVVNGKYLKWRFNLLIINPINDIFNFINIKSNFLIAIILTTLLIKIMCIPIFIIRFKNEKLRRFFREQMKLISLNNEEKLIFKKNKKNVFKSIGLKSKKTMIGLFMIELLTVILLINSIKTVTSFRILWFNLQYKDYWLSIIYILILIINELIYIKKVPPDEKVFQYIFSTIAVLILSYIVINIKACIVVFWIVSSIFNICFNIFLDKYKKYTNYIPNSKIFNNILLNILKN